MLLPIYNIPANLKLFVLCFRKKVSVGFTVYFLYLRLRKIYVDDRIEGTIRS